jgi:hypothetical protein
MPDGFFTGKNGEKWHEGPPRPGTVSMRATRFRLKAGCISWEPKAGSEKIADYILKLLPQSCIDANSTLSFRDLSKDEQEDATKPNEGTQPNRASKAKRAATVEKENKAKQMKRREKEMTEDTHTYGEDKLGSRYGEQDYTTANDAWLLEAIDRATNSSPKKNPYSTRSPELAIGQNLKRGAIHELRESDDVGGSGVRSLKRQRENPVPNATSHDLNAENVPTKMRRSSGKMPSSIATSRHSRKQALKQPLQYDEIFANDISQIVRAGNVHTYTSTPWTAFGDLGPAQEQYTSPRPSCINDPIDQLTEYNDPSNPFIFGGSNPQSHPFDGSFMPLSARALDHNMIPASSPLFDIHYADEYNSPQLPLNAHYANGFCSPQFGDAMTFDTQLPTNFAAPNPPIRKEGAIPSILHRRQAGNLKLNHSAVLTRQDGDTVPARQSHGSTPPLAGTAILKRKRAPETTESPNEPRQDAESRLTKRAKTYQQVQADLAKDLAMVPNVLDSPVAEATSEHTGGLQPENVASLPLEPLGVHAINDLNVQSYSAQDDGWSKEAFEENGSGFHLPSAFDPGYDAENYMPSYQQDREAHAKNNDYEESFAPPTEQLPVWIEDLAGWGPRNEEAQIVLDML